MEDERPLSAEGSPPDNRRLLVTMGIVGLIGSVAGTAAISVRFGLGLLVGSILSFINYFWLRRSLRQIFAAAASGERPRMLAGKYFIRYIVLALVIAFIYVTDLLPAAALVLGLAAFAFAVVIEGLRRAFVTPD